MSEMYDYFKSQQQSMVDLLTTMINYESCTQNKDYVDKLGAFMEGEFKALNASSVQRFELSEVGDMLLAKWNEDAPGKPIMFLIHIDTVWPIGTLAERPPTIEDGKLYGPGAIDMKGGVTIALSALRGLQSMNAFPERPIWLLMTTDEEVGSRYSEQTIKDTAAEAGLVLVMEPATKDGAIKIARKGVAIYKVDAKGRPSHAGLAPQQGINSVVELAYQTLKLQEMNDLQGGTSVSVTMFNGGTAMNVIPEDSQITVDVRTLTEQAFHDITGKINGLQPYLPGSQLSVELKHARGPMEYNDRMQADFTQIQAIGKKIGIDVRGESSGGGSDGNFTAMLGISTLDGLGAEGDGLHALHEHVLIDGLPRRAALMAGVLRDWEFAT